MIETGLAGKIVIVTGAAAGIGRATALRFAAEGARVAAWDVAAAAGASLVAEITAAGGEAVFAQVDVSSQASVEAAVAQIIASWGAIHGIVNNAGIIRDGILVKYKDGAVTASLSDDQFDAVINVNLKGVFVCTRAVVPHLIAAGGGFILNASSLVGLYGNFGQTNYVASKSGVIGMTKVWARELGRHNIRVNAVAPGFIATGMIQQMPEKVLERMKAGTPIGRIGTPEDIANAYLWLASDAASFVHGAVLSVDGGVVIGTM
jgi:3-oxoacyl-[acyl-carrier protein] reductase